MSVLQRIKLTFVDVAHRATPLLRNILERGARRYILIRITFIRVIYITTVDANIFLHPFLRCTVLLTTFRYRM